jgi:hypothetical protein
MTDGTEPARYAFEYPDEAGYPDENGTSVRTRSCLSTS